MWVLQVLRDHLFFQWSFTKRVWESILRLCLISDFNTSWKELVEWSVVHLQRKGLRATLCKIAWWATIYLLWNQRNAILPVKRIYSEDQYIRTIKTDVRGRVEGKQMFKNSILKCVLCCKWGINASLGLKGHLTLSI